MNRLPLPAACRRGAAALVWLVLLLGALTLRPAQAQTADTIDVNAVLHIVVAGEADLTGDYRVDTNGDIKMLYVNTVHVQGLRQAQAQNAVTAALKKYYVNPQVILTIVSKGGISVEVTGAVATQGARTVRSDAHLNDVLSPAGVAVDADLEHVDITRGYPGTEKTKLTVNYLAFRNSQDPTGNPQLQDADIIYVPLKENQPIQVNVRGQVGKPGRQPVPATTTVYDALQTYAGGLQNTADKTRLYIQHAGSEEHIPFNYDLARQQPDNKTINPVLLDGDTIEVPSTASPQIFTITGAVRNPQAYDFPNPPPTLADAIGRAGGLISNARTNDTTITRTAPNGKVTVIKRNFSKAEDRAAFILQPGDNIEIPQGSPGFKPDPLTIFGTLIGLYGIFHR